MQDYGLELGKINCRMNPGSQDSEDLDVLCSGIYLKKRLKKERRQKTAIQKKIKIEPRKLTKKVDFLFLFLWIYINIENDSMQFYYFKTTFVVENAY